MFQQEFENHLTTQKFYPFIKQISQKYTTYIFGGFIRSFLSNTPFSDVDIVIDGKMDDFKKDFPHFTEKISLSNMPYLTTTYKGTKFDISFSENDTIYNSHYNHNYFFNIFYYNINNSSFTNFSATEKELIGKKEIDFDANKDLRTHLLILEKNPIIFIKMIRFYSQSDFTFNPEYKLFLLKNADTLLSALKDLNPNTVLNEFIKILTAKNSSKFFSFLYECIHDKEKPFKEKKLPENTPINLILNFYRLQSDDTFIETVLSYFPVNESIYNSYIDFNKFYFNEHIIIDRSNILFNNYRSIIKNQLSNS